MFSRIFSTLVREPLSKALDQGELMMSNRKKLPKQRKPKSTNPWDWANAVLTSDLSPETKQVCYAIAQVADEHGNWTMEDLEDYFGFARGSLPRP